MGNTLLVPVPESQGNKFATYFPKTSNTIRDRKMVACQKIKHLGNLRL